MVAAGRAPLGAALGAALLLATCAPAARAGTLEHHAFRSAVLGREWKLAVYVPDGDAAARAAHPVLYLLHGHGGNETDWAHAGDVVRTADSLIVAGHVPAFLIVMPDGGNSWWVDGPEPIATAFVEDLIPHVERTWRADPRRGARLIAGLSMGGYGALRFALRHPRTFGAAALLSPAIYDPAPPMNSGARQAGVFGATAFDDSVWKAKNWPALWDAYRAARAPVPVWILSGDDDAFFIEGEVAKLYGRFRADSLPAELRIVDGGHDWAVWTRGLAEALPWMFEAAQGVPAR